MRARHRVAWIGATVLLGLSVAGVPLAMAAETRQAPTAAHEVSAEGGERSAHGGPHASPFGALLFYAVNFSAFVVLLVVLGRKPLRHMLRERKAGILRGIEEAAGERARAEKLLSEIEQRLARIQEESRSILEQAEREAKAEQERILAEAQAAAERMKKLAVFTIEQERKKAILAVREEAASLAVRLAETLVREKMTDEDQRRLIRDFLEHQWGEA